MESRRNIPATIAVILRVALAEIRTTLPADGERIINALDSIEAAAEQLQGKYGQCICGAQLSRGGGDFCHACHDFGVMHEQLEKVSRLLTERFGETTRETVSEHLADVLAAATELEGAGASDGDLDDVLTLAQAGHLFRYPNGVVGYRPKAGYDDGVKFFKSADQALAAHRATSDAGDLLSVSAPEREATAKADPPVSDREMLDWVMEHTMAGNRNEAHVGQSHAVLWLDANGDEECTCSDSYRSAIGKAMREAASGAGAAT